MDGKGAVLVEKRYQPFILTDRAVIDSVKQVMPAPNGQAVLSRLGIIFLDLFLLDFTGKIIR